MLLIFIIVLPQSVATAFWRTHELHAAHHCLQRIVWLTCTSLITLTMPAWEQALSTTTPLPGSSSSSSSSSRVEELAYTCTCVLLDFTSARLAVRSTAPAHNLIRSFGTVFCPRYAS
jgi:hypothetical protein